ncbi:hypothetical protein DB346_05400 [Verrucomicrobia bacterium LW23]|nr:hypothetical protein DB346_05400 [Verrucomicrobia bacterium LW23]
MATTIATATPDAPKLGRWHTVDDAHGSPRDRPWDKWSCVLPTHVWCTLSFAGWIPRGYTIEWSHFNPVRARWCKMRIVRLEDKPREWHMQMWRAE